MGLGLGGNLFWNPPADPSQSMGNSDLGLQMLESTPQTAYYRRLRMLGIPDDNSAFSNWAGSLFPKFSLGYNAATVEDPFNMDINKYSASIGGFDDFKKEFMRQAPALRGENPGDRGGGPARWIPR